MVNASAFGAFGVRARLMGLIAVATLPLGGLIVYGLASGYAATLDLARASLARTADVAADGPAGLFDNARSMLDAARADPAVTVGGGDACRAAVRSLLAGNPQFLTMGVMDREGTITCHTRIAERQAFSDPSLAERALAPGAPETIVGNFMIGKVTGKPTVAVVGALPRERGGVAFVSLDLERLSVTAEGASDNGTLAVTMIQPSSGRMLTHHPPIDVPFGTPLVASGLVEALRAHPDGGVVETAGPDGIERVYAFAPVPGGAGMMIAIGEPRSAILDPLTRTAWTTSLIGGLVLAAALAAAWWAGWLMQIRPLERLTEFARRLDAREHDARIDMEAWQPPELRALARTLNATATRLEAARRADEAVAASESRFRLLAENTADLVTSIDATGARTFVSPASRDILGREPEELLGQHPRDVAHPEDRATVDAMMSSLRSGSAVSDVRYRMAHRDGHYVWVEVSGRPLEGAAGMVMSVRDVTRRRTMESELERANQALAELAATDGLTGLLNRRGFDTALEREIARCRRERGELSLLLVDVDRFKAFNDRYGHLKGDECLRAVSSAIRGAIRRPGDTAARYGGEELAVILAGTGETGAADRARAIVEAVRALAVPHEGSECEVVTVSVGAATLGDTTAGPAVAIDLIERADRALYAAKTSGRDRAVAWQRIDAA